jgi:hypothetical protein
MLMDNCLVFMNIGCACVEAAFWNEEVIRDETNVVLSCNWHLAAYAGVAALSRGLQRGTLYGSYSPLDSNFSVLDSHE